MKYTIALFIWFFASNVNAQGLRKIECNDSGCSGMYKGPEFLSGEDIAHQFSNEISWKVGDKLKELYRADKFSKADLSKIEMSTVGMGSGNVTYKLNIPFKRVDDKCEARTSFDHCGGWDHAPEISARKSQLSKALLKGDSLEISSLLTTTEGLQEYWIQWRNKDIQADCVQ